MMEPRLDGPLSFVALVMRIVNPITSLIRDEIYLMYVA
jgi:hypothetical protein